MPRSSRASAASSGLIDDLQRLVQARDQQVGMFGAEQQRWPDLENIAIRSGSADQHALIAHGVDDPRALSRGGCSATPQFDADEQARAAHLGDQRMLGLQLPEVIE